MTTTTDFQNLRLDDWLVLAEVGCATFALNTELWPEWDRPFAEKAVLERARRTELRFWWAA